MSLSTPHSLHDTYLFFIQVLLAFAHSDIVRYFISNLFLRNKSEVVILGILARTWTVSHYQRYLNLVVQPEFQDMTFVLFCFLVNICNAVLHLSNTTSLEINSLAKEQIDWVLSIFPFIIAISLCSAFQQCHGICIYFMV